MGNGENDRNRRSREYDLQIATYMGKMSQAMEDTTRTISAIGSEMKEMRKEIKEDFEKVRKEMDTKVKGAHLRIDKFRNLSGLGGIIGAIVAGAYFVYSKLTGNPPH